MSANTDHIGLRVGLVRRMALFLAPVLGTAGVIALGMFGFRLLTGRSESYSISDVQGIAAVLLTGVLLLSFARMLTFSLSAEERWKYSRYVGGILFLYIVLCSIEFFNAVFFYPLSLAKMSRAGGTDAVPQAEYHLLTRPLMAIGHVLIYTTAALIFLHIVPRLIAPPRERSSVPNGVEKMLDGLQEVMTQPMFNVKVTRLGRVLGLLLTTLALAMLVLSVVAGGNVSTDSNFFRLGVLEDVMGRIDRVLHLAVLGASAWLSATFVKSLVTPGNREQGMRAAYRLLILKAAYSAYTFIYFHVIFPMWYATHIGRLPGQLVTMFFTMGLASVGMAVFFLGLVLLVKPFTVQAADPTDTRLA